MSQKQIKWSGEATFKLNGTVTLHSCVYWTPGNAHIHVDKVNSPGLIVWCGLSYRGLIGLCIFEGTVSGPVYHNIFWTSVLLTIHQLSGNEPFYFQQDGKHHTVIERSESTSMKPCQVSGYDEEVLLSIPHDHLI